MARTDPLAAISTREAPQSRQASPRQVPNSAGGWAFTVSRQERLHRFLTLGTTGGTYYAAEKAITAENAGVVLDWARNDSLTLVREILGVSLKGRAPRQAPALFALAAASGLGNDAGRKAAFEALPHVARTATHLYGFTGYAEQFRGWGRGMRRAVAGWYLNADPAQQVAYQVIKYRQRDGWAHRDVLRLAHPAGHPQRHGPVFDFAVGRDGTTASRNWPDVPPAGLPPLIVAYKQAKAAKTGAEWRRVIAANPSLPWEALPDEALALPEVWEELIGQGMPQAALMRQLPRLTRLGVLSHAGAVTQQVCDQLADRQRLARARVHPMNVLVAMKTYAGGRSLRGTETWVPVARVTDALDAAFYASYEVVEPAGKRTNVALDVSGSMASPVAGMPMSCREASAALALVVMATEPGVVVTGFTAGSSRSKWGSRYGTAISPLSISPRQRLDDAVHRISGLPFGGTDCALPMLWAAANNVEVDTFMVVTDNETWAGDVHPHQALERYRQKTGIPARLAVAALTPTEFTIADPDDPGSMDVSGFDSNVPGLLADFSRGDV